MAKKRNAAMNGSTAFIFLLNDRSELRTWAGIIFKSNKTLVGAIILTDFDSNCKLNGGSFSIQSLLILSLYLSAFIAIFLPKLIRLQLL
jgi:hypothetical protein